MSLNAFTAYVNENILGIDVPNECEGIYFNILSIKLDIEKAKYSLQNAQILPVNHRRNNGLEKIYVRASKDECHYCTGCLNPCFKVDYDEWGGQTDTMRNILLKFSSNIADEKKDQFVNTLKAELQFDMENLAYPIHKELENIESI